MNADKIDKQFAPESHHRIAVIGGSLKYKMQ